MLQAAGAKARRALRVILFVSVLSFILPGFSPACFAATVPVGDSGFRQLDLSGTWNLRFDPDDVGEKAAWFSGSWPASQEARVPGSFNAEFQDQLWYQGKVWYRTTVRVNRPKDPAARMFLHFLGVTLRCKVWLNGRLLGENNLPYLGFAFDATKAIRYGQQNDLVVMVDNKILAKAIPDRKWRGWWNFGGITRPVFLEERDRLSTDVVAVTERADQDTWTLRLRTVTVNAGGATSGAIRYELTDSMGRPVWSMKQPCTFTQGESKRTIDANVKGVEAWSPEHPSLYRLAIHTEDTRGHAHLRTLRVGFRKIEVRGSTVYLNDAPLQIRGVNRHEMFAGSGSTVPVERTQRDLEDIKALGSNMVRLAHYPQAPEVYDLCDELGLLVWSEIPAWQSAAETLADPAVFSSYAGPELKAMVEQHGNHPSVIIWSVANEVPSQLPEVAEYIHNAIDYVHKLDPSRLVTFASDKRERDISFGSVDLIAVNEYFGWYYGKPEDVGTMLDELARRFPNKPILISEFGAEAVPGWQKPSPDALGKDYSLQHQVEFLQIHLAEIFAPQRRKFVAGGLIWVYNDFPDPHRIGGDHPEMASYRNNKGLVTEDRRHKPAYDIVGQFFTGLSQQENGQPGSLDHSAQPAK
jgi:beta-glucuronidase